MSKRPLCTAALIWAALLWLLGQAGVPFLGYTPPGLPTKADAENALITGIIYKKDVYNLNTNLYLKNTNLILNSKEYPIDSIKVTIKNEIWKKPAAAGSKIAVLGKLTPIPLPTNPGQFHERAYYYARKIKWYQEAYKIQILQEGQNKILVLQEKIKNKMGEGISASFPEKEAGILEAMILGKKENIGQENAFLFQIMGCSHILAVSGLHLSILGGGFYKILRKLCLPMWAAGILAAAAMFFYGGLTGSGAAVIRAAVMFAAAQGAFLAKRTYDFLSAIALAAILLLTESPMYLYDSSFLLSFGAVLGLGIVQPTLFARDKDGRYIGVWEKIKKLAADGIRSGISVWCMLLPLVMYFFFEIPLGGIFINLLVLPTAGILLISGVLGGILGMLPVKMLGQAAGLPGILILEGYLKTGELVRFLPNALWITGQPELWKCGVYYLAVAVVLWQKGKKKKLTLFHTALVVLGLTVLCLRPLGSRIKLTFLDVGQGDCACIQTESRSCYLVDGGSSSIPKAGKYRILPFLKSSGIREVKGVFVSHMDEDHVNGILELLELIRRKETNMKIHRLFLSKCRETEEQRIRLEEAGKQAGCEIVYLKRGTKITEKDIMIECLGPLGDSLGSNEGSQVLRVTRGRFDALFTGDVEGQGERDLSEVLQGNRKKYEILKTAHHGSKNSTDREFLKKIHPFAAVISCAKDNRYGHPHQELLERLEEERVEILQTVDRGAVFISAGKDWFEISSYVPFQYGKIMIK